MVKVKICGNQSVRDINNSQRADALGFIVSTPSSDRNVTEKLARKLVRKAPPFLSSVLVTKESNPQRLRKLSEEIEPDYIQLHSPLSPGRIRDIRERVSERTGLITLLSVGEAKNKLKSRAKKLANSPADGIVLDSKVEGKTGGTGQVHDWELSREIRDHVHPFPVILAGGLRPENVVEAIKKVNPYCVDAATGVEKDGRKSSRKIESFLGEVRTIET